MHLSQRNPEETGRFQSTHTLFYDLPDGRTVVMLSGIVEIDLRAPGWSSETSVAAPYRLELQLDILIPPDLLANGQHLDIEQSLPYVGMGSLSGSANVLWGIQHFSVDTTEPIAELITLRTEAEVARSGEVLKSIGYAITLVGKRC